MHGIELSPDMVAELRTKPGSDDIGVTIGDFAYVWPSELDLMARLAGMRLRERWSDWHRAPFTSNSTSHVSVWEKAQNSA
jgi:hypothetical protein